MTGNTKLHGPKRGLPCRGWQSQYPSDSQALRKARDRDVKILSQVLPEDQVANREILKRLMHLYRDSDLMCFLPYCFSNS
jgi:hypothetical protein